LTKIHNVILGLLITLIIGLSIYNYLIFKDSSKTSFGKFIEKNTNKKLTIPCDYNIFFLLTPLDCCNEQFLTKDFIRNLKEIGFKKGLSICINYVISGDFSEKEKYDYISNIKDDVKIYIDYKNMAKTFILNKFNTSRTPFLIILTREGEIKYWQDFKPDDRYQYRFTTKKLLFLLEEIL